MPPPSLDLSIGVDFGTSNTVVALAEPGGHVETLTFAHHGRRHGLYATALCFWDERQGSGRRTQVEGGPWAIERFMEGGHAHRFIQSFKTFAASAAFKDTRIFRERYRFEDLLAAFLGTLQRHGGERLDFASPHLVIGRPVRFAGHNPDEALAMERYRTAFGRLGAAQAAYVYEPVGAAFFLARRLERDATVLVADFGGGTSDFSVLRFVTEAGRLRAEPLGHAGIGVAGDTFDARIVDHVVAPRLGKGGSFRSLDKVLAIPNHFYANLARWHQLATMKGSGDLDALRELARAAVEPGPLHAFIDIVDLDLGFELYRAVSAAKVALSSAPEVSFAFRAEGIALEQAITRADFERWIARDVERIAATVDAALSQAGTGPDGIDQVFLTGGTSFVPAIRRLFQDRFGEARLTSAEPFESIARGLALIGQTSDLRTWAA